MTNTAELNRRLENLIRFGTINQVDHGARKVRVKTGDLLTNWIPWPADIGRNYRRWRPLRTGTQVVLGCPSGDLSQAVIMQILYTTTLDTPSTDDTLDLIEFEDGTTVEYRSDAHQLRAAIGQSSITANQSAITIASNGSTLVLDGSGISLNGNRVDLN